MAFLANTLPLTESGLQAACHTWFHNHAAWTALRGLGFMIHNDGTKNPIQASQDKGRGLVQGVPDWCLMVPHPVGARLGHAWLHGLFVEFKVGRNSLEPVQRKRHEQLTAHGYQVAVVRTVEEFQQLLTEYLAAAGYPIL